MRVREGKRRVRSRRAKGAADREGEEVAADGRGKKGYDYGRVAVGQGTRARARARGESDEGAREAVGCEKA